MRHGGKAMPSGVQRKGPKKSRKGGVIKIAECDDAQWARKNNEPIRQGSRTHVWAKQGGVEEVLPKNFRFSQPMLVTCEKLVKRGGRHPRY